MPKDVYKVLKRYARKFPKTVNYILKNGAGTARCARCGQIVLKEPLIEGYPYQCMTCDENLLDFEVRTDRHPCTVVEMEQLIEDTACLLLLDEFDDEYFERKRAAKILTSDHILIGYELENGVLEKVGDQEIKQMLVRPISSDSFEEFWEHGKTHCSKFIIYLRAGNLFVERRPDMLNYDTKSDFMYGQEDVIAGGKYYNNGVKKDLHYSEEEYHEFYTKRCKKLFSIRIKRAIENLVEIQIVGNEKYNILFEE